MAMHSAKLENSPRLKRVMRLLKTGNKYTTREIVHLADVCAVNSIISEIRDNGYTIDCKPVSRGVYSYQLIN